MRILSALATALLAYGWHADACAHETVHWLDRALANAPMYAYVRASIYFGVCVVAVAILLLAWNYNLRRRVREKMADLRSTLAALEQAKQSAEATLANHVATLEALPDLLFEMDLDGRYYLMHAADPALMT
ncbi:MAG TPA: hypothetical protein VIT92_10130, partial [Burkholderiaceae bacterium]